ncbi:helix-turn-helix transcriptional regulator [Aquimarina rhabdastrellae]
MKPSTLPLRLSREEKRIVRLLAKGYTQVEIALYLEQRGFTPSSKSTVEKQLKKLRDRTKAKTMFQLPCLLKNQEIL